MQPIRLDILGDFWDSQVYRGRLHLWDMNNAVHTFDWHSFVAELAEATREPFLNCAFARGDQLYTEFISGPLFADPGIRELVRKRLMALSNRDFSVTLDDLEKFRLGTQDNPFPDLHDDLALFKNVAYALTERGLLAAEIRRDKRRPLFQKQPTKLWSGTGTCVVAGRGGLAIAAAEDGLFEYAARRDGEPERVAEQHASMASWLFASIYASSLIAQGYLAGFRWVAEETGDAPKKRWRRESAGVFQEDFIFGRAHPENHDITWGSQEKLYKASADRICAVRFIQQRLTSENGDAHEVSPFEAIGQIPLNGAGGGNGPPLSAGSSFFGSIVEYRDSILLVESDLTLRRLEGSVTRWRVFPRSHWYPNHLHLVLPDRVAVLSINGDLFYEQKAKISGIQFRKGMLGEVE